MVKHQCREAHGIKRLEVDERFTKILEINQTSLLQREPHVDLLTYRSLTKDDCK